MTIPPKVRLFNARRADSPLSRQRSSEPAVEAQPDPKPEVQLSIRRRDRQAARAENAPAVERGDQDDKLFAPDPASDGLSGIDLRSDEASSGQETPEPTASGQDHLAAVEAVRAEGLTSRQLRIAARLAKHHQIEAASDEEAVVLLRARGIDPLHRGVLNELLSAEASKVNPEAESSRGMTVLGRTPVARVPAGDLANVPPPTPPGGAHGGGYSEEQRAREIMRIQKDIARRRRRSAFFMFLRLASFVLFPTLLAGIYFYLIATPLYETKSEFIIMRADGSFSGSSLGGMLAGAGLSGNVDSLAVQSYLKSREAMLRLEEEVGFASYFSGDEVDLLERLPDDATQADAYRKYGKMVGISFDPSEGIIRMNVVAPDPVLSQEQSLALIGYAEQQVDQLSARLRADQVSGARRTFDEAEASVQAARDRVLELQEQLGVLDPRAETGVVMSRVGKLEGEIQQKELELSQLLANANPNAARVNGVRGDLTRLRDALAETRALLTEKTTNDASLATVTAELELAQADLVTRQTILAASAEAVEAARVEADKQVRYLSVGVNPVPPDEATYPRAFENTLVSLLIFGGVYLMLSLTVSILREQVSA